MSHRSNNYRRKTLAKLFVGKQKKRRKKKSGNRESRSCWRKTSSFLESSAWKYSHAILWHFVESAVGSQWSAMPEWAVKWTESSLCLICDVHVFAFGSGSTKTLGNVMNFFFTLKQKEQIFLHTLRPQTVVHLVAEFYYNSEKLKGSLSTSTVFDFFKLFFNFALCHLVDWRTCLNLYFFYRSHSQLWSGWWWHNVANPATRLEDWTFQTEFPPIHPERESLDRSASFVGEKYWRSQQRSCVDGSLCEWWTAFRQ